MGKILFERYPQFDATTLLVYRSTVSCLILAFWHNINLKYIMWDCIKKDQVMPLFVRVTAGLFTLFVNYMGVKYFQLTIVAMVLNTAPFITFFLAMLFFKEKVTTG